MSARLAEPADATDLKSVSRKVGVGSPSGHQNMAKTYPKSVDGEGFMSTMFHKRLAPISGQWPPLRRIFGHFSIGCATSRLVSRA